MKRALCPQIVPGTCTSQGLETTGPIKLAMERPAFGGFKENSGIFQGGNTSWKALRNRKFHPAENPPGAVEKFAGRFPR